MIIQRLSLCAALSILLSGCVDSSSLKKPVPTTEKIRAKSNQKKESESNRRFTNYNMVEPISNWSNYATSDYRELPNCLDVFTDCLRVPIEKNTTARYKLEVSKIAQRTCRIVLELVDVSAEYDLVTFKLFDDDGTSGLIKLKQGGNLGDYNSRLEEEFTIQGAKAKGLDWQHANIGDRVVLVGLGYIVPAGTWGATSGKFPDGNSRYVMLRAFGKPNRYRPHDYEFAFMVRNWHIASGGN